MRRITLVLLRMRMRKITCKKSVHGDNSAGAKRERDSAKPQVREEFGIEAHTSVIDCSTVDFSGQSDCYTSSCGVPAPIPRSASATARSRKRRRACAPAGRARYGREQRSGGGEFDLLGCADGLACSFSGSDKYTKNRSEEHTSELQSHSFI